MVKKTTKIINYNGVKNIKLLIKKLYQQIDKETTIEYSTALPTIQQS